MITLHGKEIKLNDNIWDVRYGWAVVVKFNITSNFPIVTRYNTYCMDGKTYNGDKYPSIYWEEMILTPKPKPVYEWQWVYWDINNNRYTITKFFYKSEEDVMKELPAVDERPVLRIDDSKREIANMKLVYEETGIEVKIGDLVKFKELNEIVKVIHFTKPHKPEASGKVTVEYSGGTQREYYVSVIKAKWITV